MHRLSRGLHALWCFAMLGCDRGPACEAADLAPLDEDPSFAVVASDYASTSIGLLDRLGNVVREAWLDSGSATPTLVTALSGDVVVAERFDPCTLALIDRYGTDVITLLDVCAPAPSIAQLDVGPGHDGNPQDVLRIDLDRALVSRFNPNLEPGVLELDRGDDLLVIALDGAPRIVGRVDLSALDAQVGGERVHARPSSLVRLRNGAHDVAIAGLARLSTDFMIAGPGAVARVDLPSLRASELALEGLSNCDEVDAVPDDPARAIVTCGGPAFVGEDVRRAGAGLALIELRPDGELAVRAIHRATDHPSLPVFNTWSVPLPDSRVATVAMGDLRTGVRDRVAVLDLERGDVMPLLEAESAFVIGEGTYDPETRLLLLPDAELGIVHRFAMTNGEGSALAAVEVAGCRGLPPRAVAALR